MDSINELFIPYSEEELKKVTSALITVFSYLTQQQQVYASFTGVETRYGVVEVTCLEEIKTILDLESKVTPVLGITDPLGQLQAWLAEKFGWIVEKIEEIFRGVIQWFVDRVREFIQSFVNAVYTFISNLYEGIISIFNTIASNIYTTITSISKTILDTFTSLFSNLSKLVSDAFKGITDFFTSLSKLVSNAFQNIANYFSQLWNSIQNFFKNIYEAIKSWFSEVFRRLSAIGERVVGFLSNIARTIFNAIRNVIATITNILHSIARTIMNAFTNFIALFKSIASQIVEWFSKLPDLLNNFVKAVVDSFTRIGQQIMTGFEALYKFFKDYVVTPIQKSFEWLGGILKQVAVAFTGFVNAIMRFPEWFPKWFYETIAKPIVEGLQSFAKWIWEMMPDWLKKPLEVLASIIREVWEKLYDFFTKTLPEFFTKTLPKFFMEDLPRFFSGVWEGLQNLWQKIVEGFTWVKEQLAGLGKAIQDALGNFAKQIWEMLPDWLRDIIKIITERLQEFFKMIREGIEQFTKDPITFIRKNVIEPIWNAVQWLATEFGKAIQWLSEIISKAGEIIWNAIKWVGEALFNAFINIFKSIYEFAESAVKKVSGFLQGELEKNLSGFINPMESALTEITRGAITGRIGQIHAYILFPLTLVPIYLTALGLPRFLKALARKFRRKRWRVGLPGTNFQVDIYPGAILYDIGDTLEDLPARVIERTIQAWAFITFETWRYFFRSTWKAFFDRTWLGNLPIEMPWIEYTIEIMRRYGIPENVPYLRDILWRRGYPNWFIELFTKTHEEAYIYVIDRFGNPRRVPLSPLYVQPTVHDIARFMIRDMFGVKRVEEKSAVKKPEKVEEVAKGKPEIEKLVTDIKHPFDNFIKWTKILGLHPETAIFFYLLHFKYPSPERLWEFTCRGISGLLWFRPSKDMVEAVKGEVEKVGAKMPVAPVELNFNYGKLMESFSRYMKWHDYALFAWIEGYTSDNWLIIDVLADIPTKIDQRWMVKWGIYELMSWKGAKLKTPISEIRKRVLEDRPVSKVQLDLTIFCRTLQATGLHPDWVPITAVAEAMNMLTEERTLLRTGFINLYKEGFWSTEAIETLLQKFVTASFHVAYFDLEEGEWVDKWINIPVMFLPAERKLLELRALMDRALDILRDYGRELTIAYAENIIPTKEEFYDRLNEIINKINEWFAKDYEKITGVKLPDEMKLRAVSDYWDTYIKVGEGWRDIYAVRRARYWFARLIAWLLYRISYGYVRLEDAVKLIDEVKREVRLTDYEANAIKRVAEMVLQYVAREYIPTPSQLATIAEVVPEAIKYIDKVLTARRVPEEFREIWAKYIKTRPLMDELRMLRTTLITSYAREVITEKEFEEIAEFLMKYGWTREEINIIKQIAELRKKYYELRELAREYIPTPTMFITMVEYVPEARQLFMEVVKARRIPEEWVKVWETYLNRRVIMDDLRRWLTRYEYLFSYAVPTKYKLDDVKKILENTGFEKTELELTFERMFFYRLQRVFLHLIPSPVGLTGYYRYTSIAKDLLMMKLDALLDRNVLSKVLPLALVDKLIDMIKKFYSEMLVNRAVYPDLRGYIYDLIRAYEYGVINDRELDMELNYLKKYGLKDENIDLIKRRAKLRRAIRAVIRGY